MNDVLPHVHVYGRWYWSNINTRYRQCVVRNCHHFEEEKV